MASYISSNANRFYAGIEASYGVPAAVTAVNRFPAVRLQAHQQIQTSKRLDKTGTRTSLGQPTTGRRQTAHEIRTYLTSWNGTGEPSYGPLLRAAMGGAPQLVNNLTLSSVQSNTQFQTAAPHGLTVGSAVSIGNEIRFNLAIPDAVTFVLNAPFSSTPAASALLAPAITYSLATALSSVTLYDYWDPSDAVSRMITGAAVDLFEIVVNGDYHELIFSGPAADLLDSYSFAQGTSGLDAFPLEPPVDAFDYSIVPGHLGQAWLGTHEKQFFTLIDATVEIKNNVELRNYEFGSSYPRVLVPGPRRVSLQCSLFAQDDLQTKNLYAAAKQRTPIPAMLQLGQQQGRMMAIFIPNVVPELPMFNDSETRLIWEFKNNLGKGVSDDEIYVAFA